MRTDHSSQNVDVISNAACDSANQFCDSLLALDSSIQQVAQLGDAEARKQLAKANTKSLLILDVVKGWKAASWSIENLADRFGNTHVRVGFRPEGQSKTMRLFDFAHYVMQNSNGDLNPCYVFEPRVRAPLTNEYDATIGGLFPHDMLGLLDDNRRPPYRWICLGPKRSGSPPHIDPLATSAWNALLSGRKRWAFVDPRVVGTVLPRQKIEAGGLSPLEWFQNRLPWIRQQCPSAVYETVQRPGDVIFVPAGMWHAVLNLTDTVAVTQNFIGHVEFDKAWRAVRRERPGLACEWLHLLEMSEPTHAMRARELDHADGVSTPTFSPQPRAMTISANMSDECLFEWLLLQRLKGQRHFKSSDGRMKNLPSWSAAASCDSSGRWSATVARRRGTVVFASCALSCVYDDEAGDDSTSGALAKKFPYLPDAQKLASQWGLSRTSSAEDLSQAFAKASQEVWCFRTTAAGEIVDKSFQNARVNGLALFTFAGALRHSLDPNLVLTYVGDACVCVAARDVAIGDELTVCLVPWRFSGDQGGQAFMWPKSLPPQDQPQLTVALTFLAQMEKAAWGDDDLQEQRIAASMLKKWILDCGETRLLHTYPYLRLRVNTLLLHLCLGTHLLDDAWDAAVVVLALLAHVPLHEATELCVSLALLGGALAYQLQQPTRALELFRGGEHLLMQAVGGGAGGIWKSWLISFVPQPLLQAALSAWESSEDVSSESAVGLGVLEEKLDTLLEACTNMECWEASKEEHDTTGLVMPIASDASCQSDASNAYHRSQPQLEVASLCPQSAAREYVQLDDMD